MQSLEADNTVVINQYRGKHSNDECLKTSDGQKYRTARREDSDYYGHVTFSEIVAVYVRLNHGADFRIASSTAHIAFCILGNCLQLASVRAAD
jgi:hypothetical protein